MFRVQAHVWSRFELRDEGSGFSYRFEFNFDKSDAPSPVVRWQNGTPPMEVPPQRGERGYASAAAEARRLGFDNFAVVHPGLNRDPCSPRVDRGGGISFPRWAHGIMDVTSNFMTLGYNQLTAAGSLTLAHEIGHLFGLGHQSEGDSIMRSRQGHDRSLLPEDQVRLHEAIATLGSRAGTGMLWNGPHVPPPVERGRPRRGLGRSARH